ncbi:MAG TPA: hypothetical protein VFF06_29445 [Polyangia bacterium]|nr:hypothetical protein [Polyangia bacterium]
MNPARRAFFVCVWLLAGCQSASPGVADGGADLAADLASGDGGSGYVLEVMPSQWNARQHFGGAGGAPLVFELEVPATLHGGGPPTTLTGVSNTATVELELPLLHGSDTVDEVTGSGGVAQFDPPSFCLLANPACAASTMDGYWRGELEHDGMTRAIQVAHAEPGEGGAAAPYPMVIGAFLDTTDVVGRGDRIRLIFQGSVPGRSTDWTDSPFLTHARYRDYAGGTPGAWTLLADDQVRPVNILPGAATFVHAIAPLDVAVGQSFDVAVVVTDQYGNPASITGSVALSDGMSATVMFNNEWRKSIAGSYATAGLHRIVPSLAGARAVYHYTNATSGAPAISRMEGDVHAHTGDGGAQRKFLGTTGPGDHRALYSRTIDALRYSELVAGHEFGAISEHAFRYATWALPPAVAADAQFQAGAACAPNAPVIPFLGDWWTKAQGIAHNYPATTLIAFPAFEWHGGHRLPNDTSPLHRVVLFRDFDAADALPLLPDMTNGPPRCVVRFLGLAGYDSTKALVVPHMMQSKDTNIDWDLTYAGSNSVATVAQVEDYQRVGEIFSARAFDQGVTGGGKPLLTIFEGTDAAPGKWAYRYGWTSTSAHIGLIGSSDNHEQEPGVNDDVALDGSSFRTNESSGAAFALAATRDRGGIFDALRSRRSYGTSGVRVWLDYAVDGMPMGSAIANAGATSTATITLAAGMTIKTVELWQARVGDTSSGYTLASSATPDAETFTATVTLNNPLAAPGTGEYLYYVRAFLSTPVMGSTASVDEAVWSSPVWITWSK